MIALILLVSSLVRPIDNTREISASFIEVNHRMEVERELFIQVIIWQWCPQYRRHDVVTWWIMDRSSLSPRKYRGCYAIDRSLNGKPIRFVSKILRETWTQCDPERENQKVRSELHRLKIGELPGLERSVETSSSEN